MEIINLFKRMVQIRTMPVCENRLILPPVCPCLWNSAPEILKVQFWVPLQ